MRTVLALSALAACTAAAPKGAAPGEQNAPLLTQDSVCRDRIETVRAERGLPMLDRGTASSDQPLLIAAVDKRVDGCAVLVMKNDTSDIRPIPKPDASAGLRKLR